MPYIFPDTKDGLENIAQLYRTKSERGTVLTGPRVGLVYLRVTCMSCMQESCLFTGDQQGGAGEGRKATDKQPPNFFLP